MIQPSDAILIVSFGGPERREDVLPFLENVVRGRNVPRERLLQVAEHYSHFNARTPINYQNRPLIAALEAVLAEEGPPIRVYWGNRNWRPFLADAFRAMKADGVRRVFAFVTSAYGSYSGCRQYLENLERAQQEAGAGFMEVRKLRAFYNHPGFIEPMIERVKEALAGLPAQNRDSALLLFSAHSIPKRMAGSSPYAEQLAEASRLVPEAVGHPEFRLVYQSRSGPPSEPWLEPDILDELRAAAARGVRDVVVVPIGFVSDHLEVLYDLDVEARCLADSLGLRMARAKTVSADLRFVRMIRELVLERAGVVPTRRTLGVLGPSPDICPPGCCPAPHGPRPSAVEPRAGARQTH